MPFMSEVMLLNMLIMIFMVGLVQKHQKAVRQLFMFEPNHSKRKEKLVRNISSTARNLWFFRPFQLSLAYIKEQYFCLELLQWNFSLISIFLQLSKIEMNVNYGTRLCCLEPEIEAAVSTAALTRKEVRDELNFICSITRTTQRLGGE